MAAIGAWLVGTERVSYTITHGISMNPVYYQGDLVVVIRASEYHVGDIAKYRSTRTHEEVLHRIIGGDAVDGYVFKGDNNQSIDSDNPTADQVIGRAVFHVPKGGIWLKPVLSPTSLGMIGFLIIGGGAASPRNRREIPRGRRKKKVKAMSRQGSPLAAVIKIVARLSPAMRIAAGVVALLACSGLILGVLGWIKPTLVSDSATAGQPRTMTFSYTAKVPKSAAYDGTLVSSPDPIFLKLTQRVDLTMRYDGRPGTIEGTIEVSNLSGWHTSLPLVSAQKFTGRSVVANAALDVKALAERIDAAARAIGLTVASSVVTVTATVKSANTAPFTATLKLQLDNTTLSLNGSPSSLVVRDIPKSEMVSRQIGSLMTAAQARSRAVVLLAAAIAGGFAIALMARRKLPTRTRAEIEHRYPQLLVHVEPMPSPPGKPVVNVDNFPALVKLAEKYGQMILTWRRPDADDFVVRDEGITYRYRVLLDEPTLQNVELIGRPGAGSHRRKASSPTQVS